MTTLLVMNDSERRVQVQFPIRDRTRKRLKNAATNHELTMGEVADAILDYGLSLLEGNKMPAQLSAALDKAKKDKEAREAD